jgi:hypothetical protein
VVVATQHFITDMPEGYTPGHLRALLDTIAPDVLAVEAPANVPDPWSHAPHELATVTRPWAVDQAVSIVPAGVDEPQYGVQLQKMFGTMVAAGKAAEYEKVERDFQQAMASHAQTCEQMNSKAALALWREYHAQLHRLSGGDTPWESWNEKIVANVLKICNENPGKRVAVLFGGAHAYYFVDRLAKEPSIEVIDVRQFFPVSQEQVTAHTQDVDYVRALRLLNFMPRCARATATAGAGGAA